MAAAAHLGTMSSQGRRLTEAVRLDPSRLCARHERATQCGTLNPRCCLDVGALCLWVHLLRTFLSGPSAFCRYGIKRPWGKACAMYDFLLAAER